MTEDKSFNEFIKAKLEEDVVDIPEVNLSAFRVTSQPSNFSTLRLSNFSTCLLAASLLAVCGVFAVHFADDRDFTCERDALNAIELLDVDSMTASSESYAERLLAWQDVPYAEIVD